ncbi:hypothetical protein LJK88_20180 [Paenibacillus sp. P26]|nr:hypothetical protein LJK88_20180 [Paenibacillus sp. P26]
MSPLWKKRAEAGRTPAGSRNAARLERRSWCRGRNPDGQGTDPGSANGASHGLLETVWRFKEEPSRLRQLFEFCEEALSGTDPGRMLNLPVYDELCRLYELEQGDESLYDADRTGVWTAILGYLHGQQGSQGKRRLHDLLVRLLRKETADMKRDADPGLIEAMQSYAALAEDGVRALLHRCLALFVTRAGSSGGAREAATLLEPLRKRPRRSGRYFGSCTGCRRERPRTASLMSWAGRRADGNFKKRWRSG